MVSLLKTFGKGILYVLGLPFFIIVLVLFAIFGIFAFIWQAIKSIFFFFSGQKFFPELPEDKELRLMKETANQSPYQEEPVHETKQEQDIIFPFTEEAKVEEEVKPVEEEKPVFNSVEEACFIKEETKQEEPTPVEETPIDDTLSDVLNPTPEFMQDEDVSEEKPQEETVVETAEPKMDEDEMVEELETYVPRSSNYSATEDDDGDDTDTGVNIDYDFRG